MRIGSTPIIILVASVCFAAGFKLGQRNPVYQISATEPKQSPTTTETTPVIPETSISSPVLEVEAPPEPTPIEAPTIADEAQAARAAQRFITFTDTQGRTLVAEVIEPKTDSLKIRRQSDGYVLDLPIKMLSAEDKAFAAYLQNQANPASPKTQEGLSMDEIFDQLFK